MASTAGTAAAVDAITSPSVDAYAVDSPVDATASPTVDARAVDSPVDAIPSTAVVLATSAISGIVEFAVPDTALIGEGD